MNICIQPIRVQPGEQLRNLIQEKISNSNPLIAAASDCIVFIRENRCARKNFSIVDLKLNSGGHPVFSSASAATFELALSRSIHRIAKQLAAYKH